MTAEYTTSEVLDALAPIASLLSKSEKSLQKVAPGTWQHTMLAENIAALRVATALMEGASDDSAIALEDLQSAGRAISALIVRVEDAYAKFEPGTSQHTLQRNRLKALRIALSLVDEAIAGQAV